MRAPAHWDEQCIYTAFEEGSVSHIVYLVVVKKMSCFWREEMNPSSNASLI